MKTVMVCNQKGGVGKTMISNELAYSLERSGIPYNFYELDSQGGSVHETSTTPDAMISIVDTPGYLSDNLPDQLAAADVIVIPTRASMSDRDPFERTLNLADKYAPGRQIVIVVNEWNRHTANTQYTDWIKSLVRDGIKVTCIPHSESIPRSGMAGVSALSYIRRHGSKDACSLMFTCINTVRSALGIEREQPEDI